MFGRRLVWLVCVWMVFGILLSGCGPALSERDLGTVIYEIPKVPGAEKPYKMPQLGEPSETENQGETK